jgi:hypothetical protein
MSSNNQQYSEPIVRKSNSNMGQFSKLDTQSVLIEKPEQEKQLMLPVLQAKRQVGQLIKKDSRQKPPM